MARQYLTIAEFSKRFKVPKRTVYAWIRKGLIQARTDIYPTRIPLDQKIPEREPGKPWWIFR